MMDTIRRQTSHSIAFATHHAAPNATPDDRLALDLLRERGDVTVKTVPWDAPGVDWNQYAAVLIRSTWNYHHCPDTFLAWADAVEAASVVLWNPASVVRWNADKRYLRDFEEAGIPIVPTAWIPRGTTTNLGAVLQHRGWHRAIVKPSISATAFRTWVTRVEEAENHQPALEVLLTEADAMIQPFLSEVQHTGEWSFIYVADPGEALSFSHAVVKRPVPGDFRVQNQFGGTVAPGRAPSLLFRQVEAVAEAVTHLTPDSLLYARIDGVVSDGSYAAEGTFLLMEVELIEPSLYLSEDDHAATRFARAVAHRLASIERRAS